jgi:hypothetical protein
LVLVEWDIKDHLTGKEEVVHQGRATGLLVTNMIEETNQAIDVVMVAEKVTMV